MSILVSKVDLNGVIGEFGIDVAKDGHNLSLPITDADIVIIRRCKVYHNSSYEISTKFPRKTPTITQSRKRNSSSRLNLQSSLHTVLLRIKIVHSSVAMVTITFNNFNTNLSEMSSTLF